VKPSVSKVILESRGRSPGNHRVKPIDAGVAIEIVLEIGDEDQFDIAKRGPPI